MRLLAACLLGATATLAHGDWTPPPDPNPTQILAEADSDTRAGRFADALAKHLWFHHNALKHNAGLYGVRLSFALSSWLQLARQYPPALDALKQVRDQAGARVREGKGNRGDFHDFSAISDALGDVRATVELFVWLDRADPALARAAYSTAQNALVREKQYRICGKYIDAKASVAHILRVDRELRRIAGSRAPGHGLEEFADKRFANSAETLVALLVLNDRTQEADEAVTALLQEHPEPALKEALSAARKGVVPEPWPKRIGAP